MKLYHRGAALLLALLLALNLSACGRRATEPSEPQETIPEQSETLPEETSPAPVEPARTAEEQQAAFDEFIMEEFVSSLEEEYLSIHHTLRHPEDYGIDISKAQVSVGDAINEAYLKEAREENQRLKVEFEAFDYELLTPEQQETYRLYQFLMENAIASTSEEFAYLGGAFTPMGGLQGDIASLLMEYEFYTMEDVDAYLAMMEDIPRYVEEMLDFSRVQKEKGLFMPDVASQSSRDYCKKIMDAGEDSAILGSVLSNLENCQLLNEEQKAQYQEEARKIFLEGILPCFESIYNTLGELMEEENNQLGLCYLENGKAYYEQLFRQKSGSERSVEDAKELLEEYVELCLRNIAMIGVNDEELYEEYIYEGAIVDFSDNDQILENLEKRIAEDFPAIDPVDYNVKYLDPEVAIDGVTAYYVVPQIDDPLGQKIKINPNAAMDLELPSTFTVFAHEGLPGHLYQTNYILQNLENPFRKTTSIIGYSEGYATYAELIALNYLDEQLEKDMITLEQCYTIFQNSLIALCDIGIHYDGWTVVDMEDFMDQYVSLGDVTPIYNQLLGDPAGFQPYYMGCVELLELRRNAQNELGGRFNDMEFHKVILEGGDLPFSVLADKVEAYIERAKA